MKNRILIFIISSLFCICTCCFSSLYVISSMKQLNSIREEALTFTEKGDKQNALEKTEEMISFIDKRSTVFEMMTPHEDLLSL